MNDTRCRPDCTSEDVAQQICDILGTQVDLAGKVFNILSDGATQLLHGAISKKGMPQTSSCCDIPEPCWMPAEIGEVACHLCYGGRGFVRFRVTNTDMQPRAYSLAATGEAAAQVSFDVPTFQLGPKERRVVTATFTAPDKKTNCPEELEALVWVMGCRKRYLRWVVEVGGRERPCCHEFDLLDGPDYVHHWYDHFYCRRSCFG
jgi:hypothetical protein